MSVSGLAEYQQTVVPLHSRFGNRRAPGPPLQQSIGAGTFDDADALKAELAAVERSQRDTMSDDMNARLAKLEGASEGLKMAVEGLRHSQNITLAAVVGVGAILLTVTMTIGLYSLQRIDSLPGEFHSIAQTLSAAITASKQQAPQVILMPAPQVQQPAPQPTPPPTPPKSDQ
jgi:hypothetical protein